MTIFRLNYAVELRYGVLVDIGLAVYQRRPVDLSMGNITIIWQRDANSVAWRSLAHCQSPPLVLNITGPELLSVRAIAQEFAKRFDTEPVFSGAETGMALLNNAGMAHAMFGYPTVSPQQAIDWVAHWIKIGGPILNKPTYFDVQDGKF